MKDTVQRITLLLGFLFLAIYLIPFTKANPNFTNGLELGTQIYEVKLYEEVTWNNTVNSSINPSYWFGGEANIVGAESKLTIEEFGRNEFITSVIFIRLIFLNETLSIFSNVSKHGYSIEYINEQYPHLYKVWAYSYHYWSFTTIEFDVHPNFRYEHSFILQYPLYFKQILDNYNDYAGRIDNDPTLQSLNISFPILSGDDLVWQFIVRRFVVGRPIKDYLTEITNFLECKNATIEDNTLIFQKYGVKPYIIEVSYNSHGIIDTFIVKNSEDYIFYKITSFYPKTVVFIILGIVGGCVLGITILYFFRKIKPQRRND